MHLFCFVGNEVWQLKMAGFGGRETKDGAKMLEE
jgi:hypothetical protein